MAEVFGETSESVADSLPRTCTIVEKNAEREVYIVGTAHFSRESQEDVGIVSLSIFYLCVPNILTLQAGVFCGCFVTRIMLTDACSCSLILAGDADCSTACSLS